MEFLCVLVNEEIGGKRRKVQTMVQELERVRSKIRNQKKEKDENEEKLGTATTFSFRYSFERAL